MTKEYLSKRELNSERQGFNKLTALKTKMKTDHNKKADTLSSTRLYLRNVLVKTYPKII